MWVVCKLIIYYWKSLCPAQNSVGISAKDLKFIIIFFFQLQHKANTTVNIFPYDMETTFLKTKKAR
jgi:hypothetical protein